MPLAAARTQTGTDLIASARAATGAVEALLSDATRAVAARVTQDGRISGDLLDREIGRASCRERVSIDV